MLLLKLVRTETTRAISCRHYISADTTSPLARMAVPVALQLNSIRLSQLVSHMNLFANSEFWNLKTRNIRENLISLLVFGDEIIRKCRSERLWMNRMRSTSMDYSIKCSVFLAVFFCQTFANFFIVKFKGCQIFSGFRKLSYKIQSLRKNRRRNKGGKNLYYLLPCLPQ